MTVEIARGVFVDADARLLVEVNPEMLKSIMGSMVMRQNRMQKIIQDGYDNGDHTFIDAAITEKERAYIIGRWAEGILQSLAPERIEEEWYTDDHAVGRLRQFATRRNDGFYPVDDEV